MKRALFVLVAGTIISGVAAFASSNPPAKVTLTRLDCGTVAANDLNAFSDADAYTGKSKTLAPSCYLIRHGDDLMIWDTGLPAAMKGKPIDPKLPMDATVTTTLVEQLAELGIKPEDIGRVGISHFHFDHIGQASSFPGATLLIGAADWNELSAKTPDKRLDPDAARATGFRAAARWSRCWATATCSATAACGWSICPATRPAITR